MNLLSMTKKWIQEKPCRTFPRPYVNHSVEFKRQFSQEACAKMLERVGLNVFFFPSEMISGCDLLSDSGTTTMTNEQWASLHLADEAYGSNRGYFLLRESITQTFGAAFFNDPTTSKPNAFIFHQGRPCEDALFSILGKQAQGLIIPSNGHFDTTQANIEAHGIQPLNLFSPELKDTRSTAFFKGDMDSAHLKTLLEKDHHRIPLVYLTITNNTGGGQPVSMKNIVEVSRLAHTHNIPLFFDACRFAENAWFIKQYEKGYSSKTIPAIVQEMFSYVDGFTISFKKDGLVNMGGGLFLRNDGLCIKKYPEMPDALMNYQIIKEGHPTYGGLSGRDIMALSIGLKRVVSEQYLTHRINQVQQFGECMGKQGIPVVMPIGGHAVYLNMDTFFEGTNMKAEDYGGIAFTALLLATYGHRTCELGHFAFGSYNATTRQETFPEINYVRFAVPRLRYEQQDLDAVADAVKNLHDLRHKIPKVRVTYGRDLPLRHFKARFAFKNE